MNFFWNIFALKQREENNSKLFAKQSCQIFVLQKRYTAHMQCKTSNSKTKIIYTRFTHPHDVDHMVANMLYITPLCEIICVTIRYSVELFIPGVPFSSTMPTTSAGSYAVTLGQIKEDTTVLRHSPLGTLGEVYSSNCVQPSRSMSPSSDDSDKWSTYLRAKDKLIGQKDQIIDR